jgi:hypothetical protein
MGAILRDRYVLTVAHACQLDDRFSSRRDRRRGLQIGLLHKPFVALV